METLKYSKALAGLIALLFCLMLAEHYSTIRGGIFIGESEVALENCAAILLLRTRSNFLKGNPKAKKDASDESSKSKLKPATAINARHILCEKHSRATEALEKIKEGQAFNTVAQEYSEDKAKCASLST